MAIGGFPGINNQNRATIRGPVNPLDRSTIVSIYPKDIEAKKETITPGVFKIAKGNFESPSLLVVGSSSWWKDAGEEQPLLEIVNSSIQVADSIVKDYCNGLFGCNMGDSMPGLFFIMGEMTVDKVKKEYSKHLEAARLKQTKYYQTLVLLADGLWSRTNGSPLSISNDMRLAAKELNLNDKDWMKEFTMMDMTKCPACGFSCNPSFPVCSNCKCIIDQKKAESLGIKFAS